MIEGDDPPLLVLKPRSYVYESYDSQSHFFNLGLRGQVVLLKLSGFLKAGYRINEPDNSIDRIYATDGTFVGIGRENQRDTSGMFAVDADLIWAASPKLTSTLQLSRDFSAAAEGNTTEESSIRLLTNYSMTPHWSADNMLSYTRREYQHAGDREDDQYLIGLNLTYRPSHQWQFVAGYHYSENASTQDNYSYENHRLSLQARFAY